MNNRIIVMMKYLAIFIINYFGLCFADIQTNETYQITNETYKHTLQELKNGILNFTLQLEQTISESISENKDNILFAPLNIINVLSILLLGSEFETRNEILNVLKLTSANNLTNNEEINIHKALEKLLESFLIEQQNNSLTKINIAKGIFIQKDTQIREEFKNLSQELYKNELHEVDFTANFNATKEINEWVLNRTEGRINDIIQSVSPNTKLILLNTLYFDGTWDQPFHSNTTWQSFYNENETVLVEMMMNQGSVYIYIDEDRDFTALGLPYKEKHMFMYIILPHKNRNLRKLLSEITVKDLLEIPLNSTEQTDITYLLPKMSISENLNLKAMLQQLGVELIFDPMNANLGKIADSIFVGDAVSKINLDVTEAGTYGSAATALVVENRISDKYIVNRPFSFFVYHRASEMIIFWGTVNLPVPYKKIDV